MWELDHKESWAPKNWCFWTAVLEKTLESPLDCKEIKTANPKGNQPWIFIEKTHAKAPILGPSDVKTWLIRKDLMLGKIEGRRRRGQQRMRWLDGITDTMDMSLCRLWGFGDGQGSLVCCSPWGRKESDTTQQLNNNYVYIVLLALETSIVGRRNRWTWLVKNKNCYDKFNISLLSTDL